MILDIGPSGFRRAPVILEMNVGTIGYGIAFMAAGVLSVVFRQRFVEWVASRNNRYGIVKRHDSASRLAAWLVGVMLVCSGFVMLLLSIR